MNLKKENRKKMDKTILITGVAGLLGSRLADWIIKNQPTCKVIGIDDLSGGYKENIHPEVKFYQIDCKDKSIKDIFEDTRSIAEPAGALSLAGLKKYCQREQCENQVLIAIDSGANMNFDRLRHISERTEIGEKREAIFAVTIPEKAGAFKTFCHTLGKRNITEFNYRYADNKEAYVFVGIQLRSGTQERLELKENLEKKGYAVLDLSDDEMAKLHIRHLVGGHAGLADEHLFRFEFPERPGALLNFLSRLSGHNISLFHYRNHGAAYGRVLIGLQLGKKSKDDLLASLQAVGYPFSEESSNPAYQLFLR